MFLRPTLHMSYEGSRIKEEVSIWYEVATTASPGNLSVPAGKMEGKSRHIRAWVHNLIGFPAHNCQVFVQRIWRDDNVIEAERTPLHWTDEPDSCFVLPLMRWGHENGHYIDICSTDSVAKRFKIHSQKSTRGYHNFDKSGVYKLDLAAEALTPCSFGKFSITVNFDGGNWKNLQILSVKPGRKWSRWW